MTKFDWRERCLEHCGTVQVKLGHTTTTKIKAPTKCGSKHRLIISPLASLAKESTASRCDLRNSWMRCCSWGLLGKDTYYVLFGVHHFVFLLSHQGKYFNTPFTRRCVKILRFIWSVCFNSPNKPKVCCKATAAHSRCDEERKAENTQVKPVGSWNYSAAPVRVIFFIYSPHSFLSLAILKCNKQAASQDQCRKCHPSKAPVHSLLKNERLWRCPGFHSPRLLSLWTRSELQVKTLQMSLPSEAT